MSSSSANVRVLVGEDTGLVQERLKILIDENLSGARDFNLEQFTADECDMVAVINACQLLPMMASSRVVVLTRLHKLKKDGQETLLAYLAQSNPSTVLLLCADKLDARLKLSKSLKKNANIENLVLPKANELSRWLIQRCDAMGIELRADAAWRLSESVPHHSTMLLSACAQLATYAHPDAIGIGHVESLIAVTKLESIFELTDAVGERSLPKAMQLLQSLLSGQTHGLMILSMVSRHFRQLLSLRSMDAAEVPNAERARIAGIRPFLMNSLMAQARQYSISDLKRTLDIAENADRQIKSTRVDHKLILANALVAMMQEQNSSHTH